jgi:hypothetical protein
MKLGRRSVVGICIVALATIALLSLGLTSWIGQSTYASLTAGVQAAGVVIALGLGAATLMRDNRDRRVDRVLALHQELMTGDIWQARYRLVRHLRKLGKDGKSRPVSRQELINDPTVSRYPPEESASPLIDADLLVRFFERADAARRTDALHLPLFAELIGRHALWWDTAILDNPGWATRIHLAEMAAWCHQYVEENRSRRPDVMRWMAAVQRDF